MYSNCHIIKKLVVSISFFLVFFFAIPYAQLDHLYMMPGDLVDARLNNYFLENIYQFIRGNSPSLVNLSFFYPFPYVLGFSDNLFGSFPAYLIPRFLTGQSDTAFQIWYLFGYFLNYIAAFYALRKLDASVVASVVGALIFAFALPVTAQAGHDQLHYRFAVPLSITMFILFLDRKDWRCFTVAIGWLVWQFYCSIYIGVFLLLVLAVMSCIYVFTSLNAKIVTLKTIIGSFTDKFYCLTGNEKLRLIIAFFILVFLMGLLFYPYIQVSSLYGAKRHWDEISTMLPRLQSYFLSDGSWLWSSQSKVFANIPVRNEHQMFIGVVPLILAIGGFLVGRGNKNGIAFTLLGGSLAILILLTLYVGGFSLWYFFSNFPLFSAIRAMSRIILVLLFPVAFLCAVAVDRLRAQSNWGQKILFIIFIPAMLFEFSAISLYVSPKAEWRNRLAFIESVIPNEIQQNPILFSAQQEGQFDADELDAMWIGLRHGWPTLNGYSGLIPPAYSIEYGNDCGELPRRIISYLNFVGENGNATAYRKLVNRVVPIGLSGCNPDWLINPPLFTSSVSEYSADEFRALSYEYLGRGKLLDKEYIDLKINNSGNRVISARSAINKPVRLSWRFVDVAGNPLSDWEARKNLPFDIPAHGSLDVRIPIDPQLTVNGVKLQVSIVQELVFWGHDIGVSPLVIDWISK
jgi:hypothetical protein